MPLFPDRCTDNRRDDVLLSYVQQAPELLAEMLLEMAFDLADAYRRFGNAVPEFVRLAHELAVQPDDAERRDLLDRFLDALRDAWRR